MGFHRPWIPSLVVVVVTLLVIQFGFVVLAAPVEDLILNLPGQPTVGFQQYSGYVTVNKHYNRQLFYYFVEATASPESKPLTLWLNGGPGCSSVGGGAFSELGPFYPTRNGTALYQNPTAWNRVSNLLFLESPFGVGFSHSVNRMNYTSNDTQTARDSLQFLLGWFAKFPEYCKNNFYIAGESYAGHYIPQLAAAVVANNHHVAGHQKINLKAILMGNPVLDYLIDFSYSPIQYLATHGMISEATYDTIQKKCHFTTRENKPCIRALKLAYNNESQVVKDVINVYDVLSDVCTKGISKQAATIEKMVFGRKYGVDACIDDEETTYLNLPEVQRALHAKTTNWTICNNNMTYHWSQEYRTMIPVLADLLQNGVRVWTMSGDADFVIPVIGTRKVINTLARRSKLKVTTAYQPWYQGDQVGGWWIRWGDLSFITVRAAGHMIPQTQGARGLQIFKSFLNASPLPNSRVNDTTQIS